MASISVSKCFEPLVVMASGNSAVFLSLNKVTFLTSTKIFCFSFSTKKSNLVSLLKKTSGLILSLFSNSFMRLFDSPWLTILLAMCVLTPTKLFFALIISKPYLSFLLGSSCLSKKTSLPSSRRPFIEPVFGQCAVTISLPILTSTKKRLYLLINLPFIKDLVNSIFKLYI